MRYIGGKSLLLDLIQETVGGAGITTVLDIFSGSNVVGNFFKQKGYHVTTNDFLYFSFAIARGTVGINRRPDFRRLGIPDVLGYLNRLTPEEAGIPPEKCFIHQNYAPNGGCSRMYFQPKNALKIDLIRLTIEKWNEEGVLDEDEYFYLLAALLNAVPYVANIAGVFGAYLKYWDKRTCNDLSLEDPELIPSDWRPQCLNQDYTAVLPGEYDLMYADPPYNSREYLPNYHVLETIARYDYPEIRGLTGLRPYEGQKSLFCKKNTVYEAFETLVRDAGSKYILISYNNEGLLDAGELTALCEKYAVKGTFRLIERDYRRYKNKIPNNRSGLKEQLYFFRRR